MAKKKGYRIINYELGVEIPAKDLKLALKARDAIELAHDPYSDEWFVEHADGSRLTDKEFRNA